MIDSDVRVDFTPSWWPRHCRGKTAASRALVGRAVALVLGDLPGDIHNVQANDRNLHAFVIVPTEARVSFVEQIRDGIVERLEALEHEAQDSGELRKPTETLLVENHLWKRIALAFTQDDKAAAEALLQDIKRLQAARAPFTQPVGSPYCDHRDRPVSLRPGERIGLVGSFSSDMAAVIVGYEATGTATLNLIDVVLFNGMREIHQTTLDLLLRMPCPAPPLWVPPRQNYEVRLINRGHRDMELTRFDLHGFEVDFDHDVDVRGHQRQI